VYSYEDRIRAVQLYLKLGKRIRATIRQLGYPTKNSLKAWHREYERCHDLRSGYLGEGRATFDATGGLAAATTRRRRYGSYRGEISSAPENLINCDFRAAAPNQKWLTDIRPDAELVNAMLDSAIETVADSEDRPVVHSDRGAHYRWPGWLFRMRDARLVRSMSRKGCSPDNAPVKASSDGSKRNCSKFLSAPPNSV